MKTVVIHATECDTNELVSILSPAIAELCASKPVAIPTETVYGLAANALDPIACQRIYDTKNRPLDNPLIVHISSLEMLPLLVKPLSRELCNPSLDVLDNLVIPERLKPVLRRFWPGPLTVLLPKKEGIPDIVTAGLETVAIRFPAHPVAQKLISICGFPLAAPSANLSGRPSPTTAKHVLDDLDGKVGIIINGGSSNFGLESTVLDATRSPPMILRPGSITTRMLKEFLPDVKVFKKDLENLTEEEVKKMEDRPATPGMKYRHYSPTSPLLLFQVCPNVDLTLAEEQINDFIIKELSNGHRIARLAISSPKKILHDKNYFEFPLSLNRNPEEIAKNLFAGLRAADAMQPDLIIAQSVPEDDEGLAIMNRLSKAASAIRPIE